MSSLAQITELFKVSQDGSMHVVNARGMSLEGVLSSLMFSSIYCTIQIVMFYYLQSIFVDFYDRYGNHQHHSAEISSGNTVECGITKRTSVLSFCLHHIRKKTDAIHYLDIESYRKYGLDSYLFLRFLYVCLYFFVGIALVSLPTLLPVNYMLTTNADDGSELTSTSGLDLISISVLTTRYPYKYILHFLVIIFIVFWFHYILDHETKFYYELMRNFNEKFSAYEMGQRYLKTMYLENIDTIQYPTKYSILGRIDSLIPGCVEDVYPLYYSAELEKLKKRHKKLENQLERYFLELKLHNKGEIMSQPKSTMLMPFDLFGSGYNVTISGISHQVDKVKYLKYTLREISERILFIEQKFTDNESLDNPFLMSDKVIVKFKSVACRKMMSKTSIFEENCINSTELKETEFSIRDLDWEGIFQNGRTSNCPNKAWEVILLAFSVMIIMCWVIPVACVATISQLDYLTMLIPTMKWIDHMPKVFKEFLSWMLPTIVLTFLTTFALGIIRFINNKKRHISGKLNELRMQNWVFVFLFFQLFMVITISSGFIVVIEKLLSSPLSIPMIIAVDFPKASNFFISFFILRGLSLMGNNTLQFYNFIKKVVLVDGIYHKFFNVPLESEKREAQEKRLYEGNNYWGQVYPTFSVYGCIGIVYSIISPLILVFCCINFTLDLIGYKYSIKYTLNRTNKSETYGKLYLPAFKQLYAGIYSLEVFAIGLFASVRDEQSGRHQCVVLSVLLGAVLALTVYTQHRNSGM